MGMRHGQGTERSPEWIKKKARENDGKPFNDKNLRLTCLRSIFYFTLPDLTIINEQCRYDPDPVMFRAGVDAPDKIFRIRRPAVPGKLKHDGEIKTDGEYVFGIGERGVIYNWPAIIAAPPGSDVHFTEGPTKAQFLIDRGLIATCTIDNILTDAQAAQLADHNVFLHEDKDENKRGEKNAARWRDALTKFARSVRIVTADHLLEAPPGRSRRARTGRRREGLDRVGRRRLPAQGNLPGGPGQRRADPGQPSDFPAERNMASPMSGCSEGTSFGARSPAPQRWAAPGRATLRSSRGSR